MMTDRQPDIESLGFETFRGADAKDYAEHEIMPLDGIMPVIAEGLTIFAEAGSAKGQLVEMLYLRPGMSLTRVWFKSGYPLPHHSDESDCVYFIIAGNVSMGEELLGPGDGFFVASSVPYTYTVGPQGVEVLEFRTTATFNIRFMANNRKSWDKAAEQVKRKREQWASEPPPSQLAKAGL
jgi:hypothetical protein